MGQGKRRSREICAYREESCQDSKVGAQELQARAEQATKKLPSYTPQYYKGCSGNCIVWQANEDEAT